MNTTTTQSENLATILAALRLFQLKYQDKDADDIRKDWPEHFEGIAPLSTPDIDALCNALNANAAEAENPITPRKVTREPYELPDDVLKLVRMVAAGNTEYDELSTMALAVLDSEPQPWSPELFVVLEGGIVQRILEPGGRQLPFDSFDIEPDDVPDQWKNAGRSLRDKVSKYLPDIAKEQTRQVRAELLNRLQVYAEAHSELLDAWTKYEDATGDIVPNEKYPFNQSFDEVLSDVYEFQHDVREKLA